MILSVHRGGGQSSVRPGGGLVQPGRALGPVRGVGQVQPARGGVRSSPGGVKSSWWGGSGPAGRGGVSQDRTTE